MIICPHVLLKKSENKRLVVGEPFRVRGGFIHTVQIVLSHFVGRVSIEATLAANPSEEDWFPVMLGDERYVEYKTNTTKTLGFTIRGNFVWVRAKVERDYWVTQFDKWDVSVYGAVDSILFK